MANGVLTLMVRQQRPRRDLDSVLCTLHPHPLPLPIHRSHLRRQIIIRHHKHPSRRVSWLTIHAHHLPCIRPEANPAEEAYEDIENLLQPLRLGRRNKSIFSMEVILKSMILCETLFVGGKWEKNLRQHSKISYSNHRLFLKSLPF